MISIDKTILFNYWTISSEQKDSSNEILYSMNLSLSN